MSEPKKRAPVQPRAPAPKPKQKKEETGTMLEESPVLFSAVDAFVRDNTSIESSPLVDSALNDLAQCRDLMSVFTTALRRQIFGMDAALRLLLFLATAPARAREQHEDPPFSLNAPLPVEAAMELLTTVYDLGVQEAVFDYFEGEDSSEDTEGSEDEEGAAGAGNDDA